MNAAPVSISIKTEEISAYHRMMLARATLKALRNTRQNDPELWERIEKRAAEIRKNGEYGSGGK